MTGKRSQIVDAGFHAIIGGSSVGFDSLEEKFNALVDAWESENAHRSVIDYNQPAYHQVMAMGPVVVPMLLAKLRDGESSWVYALKCISGVQAESPEMYGDIDRVIQAWLEWGETQGVRFGRI